MNVCHSPLRLFALVAALLVFGAAACTFDSTNLTKLQCSADGVISDGRVCRDGFWVEDLTPDTEVPDTAFPDIGPPDVEVPDVHQPDVEAPDAGDDPDVCIPESDPVFCARLAADCGQVSGRDNCGVERQGVECGTCTAPDICHGDNRCACPDVSTRELCDSLGYECGLATNVADGCGGIRDIQCGNCEGTGEECTPTNKCVCTPKDDDELCDDRDYQCGTARVTDNCGQPRDITCGGCTGPGEVCTPQNQCVCTPKLDAVLCIENPQIQCGTARVTDNCGQPRDITCRGCTGAGEVCTATNTCECPEKTEAQLCADNDIGCGTAQVIDNCNVPRNIDCGECGAGQACEDNMCVCAPKSDAALCAEHNIECGTAEVTDNCSAPRTIVCGSCGAGQTCESNVCICAPETYEELCARATVCGTNTVTDRCNNEQTVSCNKSTCEPAHSCTEDPDDPSKWCCTKNSNTSECVGG